MNLNLNSESESFYSANYSPGIKPLTPLDPTSNKTLSLEVQGSSLKSTPDDIENPSQKLSLTLSYSKILESNVRKILADTKVFDKNLETSKEQHSKLDNTLNILTTEFENCKTAKVEQLTSGNENLEFDINRLSLKLSEESSKCSTLEDTRRLLQSELAELTTNLSEEANNMVEEEKIINQKWVKKFQALEDELKEYDIMLEKEKEMVAELKAKCKAVDPTFYFEAPKAYDNLSTDLKYFNLPEPSSFSGFSCVLNLSDSLENDVRKINTNKSFSCNDHKFAEFKEFLEAPPSKGLYLSSKFMKRVHVEDIEPTLRFEHSMQNARSIQKQLLSFVHSGTHNITPLECSNFSMPHTCFFCTSSIEVDPCFHIDFTTEDSLNIVCFLCYKRVSSVCEFFAFLRSAKDKKETPENSYSNCLIAKQNMFLARVGLQFSCP